jgi:predicted Rossmann fold flavoprotein
MADSNFWDVIVIGAGAAGLLAATHAAERGRCVLLLEKNRKPGVKILMSGGTRCNLTHATDRRGIVEAFGRQGRFLQSALAALGPDEVVQLVEAEGVKTQVESTGKVFPASGRAADVLDALLDRMRRSGAELALAEPVLKIEAIQGDAGGVGFRATTSRRTVVAERVVLTTGGQSYPRCGTSGDGYVWAAEFGHTVTPLRPALVPVTIRADWAKSLRGIAVPDVVVTLRQTYGDNPGELPDQHILARQRGSLLFAHFGLSGPVVLDISRHITMHARPRSLELVCDFQPEVTDQSLADRLQASAARDGKRLIPVLLAEDLPRRLADALTLQAGVSLDQRAAELSRRQRARLVQAVKSTPIPTTGTMGFEKAEVTAGGVALGDIDSRTMSSKIVPGLFLAGEILDLDGPIGGYNFQAAFSTGWLAGRSV